MTGFDYAVVVPPELLGPMADWCKPHHPAGYAELKRIMGARRGRPDAVTSITIPVPFVVHEPFVTWLAERGLFVDITVEVGPGPVYRLRGQHQDSWPLREYIAALEAHINAHVPGVTITDDAVIINVDEAGRRRPPP